MATTQYQCGSTMLIPAHSGALTKGDCVLQGFIFGVALNTTIDGADAVIITEGVHLFPKTTSEAWTQGAKLYFDPATGKLTTTAGSLKQVARAWEVAGSADTTGYARILDSAI